MTKFDLVSAIERALRRPSRRLWMCDKGTLERIARRLQAGRRAICVMTVWRTLAGDVDCHAGPEGSFDADVDPHGVGEVLKRFRVRGSVVETL